MKLLLQTLLICLGLSFSNEFLFDTSTPASVGNSGLSDKHYYDLLDLIMEERRGRRQLEQYITGPLQQELQSLKNESDTLKATYQNLSSDNLLLQEKLKQLENGTGSKVDIHRLELQLNHSFQHSEEQITNLKIHVGHMANNFSGVQNKITINMTKLRQQLADDSETMALQACGGYPISKQMSWGTVYYWMAFHDIKASYGFRNLSSLQKDGIFYAEKAGLYLVVVSIMSRTSNSKIKIISYTVDRKVNLLSMVQIVPYYSRLGSGITMDHSGTGSAVVQLGFNDTLYIEPSDIRSTYSSANCLTIVKLK